MASHTTFHRSVVGGIYRAILKPIFFRRDPEDVHDRMTSVGVMLGRLPAGRALTRALFDYENDTLHQRVLGIDFRNPIGLAAGFDKNAQLTDILSSVGFGFAEVGSITGAPCAGNPKPRLWRLPKSQALVIYYGLKNDGCEAISRRLAEKVFDIPIGISVAMTNIPENADVDRGIADFAKAFTTMEPFASYLTVNISCPNVSAGQPFIEQHNLEKLFKTIDLIPTTKPIFIKLSPDLSREQIDTILDVVREHRVHGIICTNLTKKRDNAKILDAQVPEKGGISGKVVEGLSEELLSYIYRREGKRFVLVGCGGVFSAEDAYRKIRSGATLIQMITGMVFRGPQVIGEINEGLTALLKRDGFASISEAIGADIQ